MSLIVSMDKVWAYLVGVVVFKEKLHILSIIGACEVWFAIVGVAFYSVDENAEEVEPLLSPSVTFYAADYNSNRCLKLLFIP